MHEPSQNAFFESIKYYIGTRHDQKDILHDSYLVTVSMKIKIPTSLKSQLAWGRDDWLNDVEFSNIVFQENLEAEQTVLLGSRPDDGYLEPIERTIKVDTNGLNSVEQITEVPSGIGAVAFDGSHVNNDNREPINENTSSNEVLQHSKNIHDIKITKRQMSPQADVTSLQSIQTGITKSQFVEEQFKNVRQKKTVTVKKKVRQKVEFPCEHCGKKFRSVNNLKYHLPKHSTERPFKCNQCPMSFKSEPVLKQHLYLHSGVRPFECEVCGRAFALKNTLHSHMRTHTGEKPYVCHICGNAFSRSIDMQVHVLKHKDERPFQCEHCPKTFASKHEMTHHIRIHVTLKKYQCEICGKKFREQSSLLTHARLHTGEKPFQCSLCKSCFATKAYLTKHAKTHKSSQDFKCEECGKLFKTRCTLNKHQVIHSDERPFTCDICHKSFKLMYVLQQHARMHKDVKDYKCDHCDKLFTFKSSLHAHLKIRHKNEKQHVMLKPVVIHEIQETPTEVTEAEYEQIVNISTATLL